MHAYEHEDSGSFWNERGINRWVVTGNASVPAFSAEVPGVMPQFTALLPTVISRSKDLSITFSYANLVNADSAHLIIYKDGDVLTSNVAAAYGGTVTISKELLRNMGKSALYEQYVDLHGEFMQARQSAYPGGLILLTLFNHTARTFGGKRFAFVNQRQIMGSVRFVD